MKLLAVILIGWLAVAQVSANSSSGCFSWFKRSKQVTEGLQVAEKEVNFDALNLYLAKNFPRNDGLRENLDYIQSNIDRLTGGVKAAGQMLVDMYKSDDQCNNNMLSIMLELRNTSLTLVGQNRVEKFLKEGWTKARELCTSYIDNHYHEADPEMAKFFREFSSPGELTRKQVYFKLKQLAKDNPDTEFDVEDFNELTGDAFAVRNRAMFDHAFEELLVKSCKRVVSNDELLKNMLALRLAEIEYNIFQNRENLYVMIDAHMEALQSSRRTCNTFLNMDSYARKGVYKS